jgi:hypothetical protein
VVTSKEIPVYVFLNFMFHVSSLSEELVSCQR